MEIRMLPKVLLWMMLVLSSIGTISFWLKPEQDTQTLLGKLPLEQQMAMSTATSFAREWMSWSGDEPSEDRKSRLKPYVSPAIWSRISQMKAVDRGSQQKVIAADFVSLTPKRNHVYSIRVRVVAGNPARTIWEIAVPVLVQADKGSSVIEAPVVRPVTDPLVVPASAALDPTTPNEVKLRMRPTIESFLRAMCEGKDAESLANYVSTGSSLVPLQGRLKLVSLDDFEATGNGPYSVKTTFMVQDATTGFSFTQVWSLKVTEENQKFFVSSME